MDQKKKLQAKYPKEFKEETFSLVREQGYSVAKATEGVGVTPALL